MIGWIATCAVGLLVVAGVGYLLWDRHRYRGAAGRPEAFRPTPEVFRDPASGRLTRVYEDPATGRRQYREEGGPPAGPTQSGP